MQTSSSFEVFDSSELNASLVSAETVNEVHQAFATASIVEDIPKHTTYIIHTAKAIE